jgi:hypothetical protein
MVFPACTKLEGEKPVKTHLAYLTATRYLFGEKHHTAEETTLRKEKPHTPKLEVVASRLKSVRHMFRLLAARLVSGSGDDLQHGP